LLKGGGLFLFKKNLKSLFTNILKHDIIILSKRREVNAMQHNHNETNTTYQIGKLVDNDGKSFDITVITNWTKTFDPDDDNWTNLIDFYFGDYNESTTDYYINRFIERQKHLIKSIEYLEKLKSIDPTDTEIDTTINCLKSLVVKLH
jgi:predicted PolB exonuclease-like 3'-5' exonuclease